MVCFPGSFQKQVREKHGEGRQVKSTQCLLLERDASPAPGGMGRSEPCRGSGVEHSKLRGIESKGPEAGVLVICCCIMNYHRLIKLKQHTFTISQFLFIGSPGTAHIGLLQGCNQGVGQDSDLIQGLGWEKHPLSSLRVYWQHSGPCRLSSEGLSFLLAVSWRPPPLRCPVGLSTGSSRYYFKTKEEVAILCNRITCIQSCTSGHLCHILLVRCQSQVLPSMPEVGVTSRYEYQDMGVTGATVATVLHCGEIHGLFQGL